MVKIFQKSVLNTTDKPANIKKYGNFALFFKEIFTKSLFLKIDVIIFFNTPSYKRFYVKETLDKFIEDIMVFFFHKVC